MQFGSAKTSEYSYAHRDEIGGGSEGAGVVNKPPKMFIKVTATTKNKKLKLQNIYNIDVSFKNVLSTGVTPPLQLDVSISILPWCCMKHDLKNLILSLIQSHGQKYLPIIKFFLI